MCHKFSLHDYSPVSACLCFTFSLSIPHHIKPYTLCPLNPMDSPTPYKQGILYTQLKSRKFNTTNYDHSTDLLNYCDLTLILSQQSLTPNDQIHLISKRDKGLKNGVNLLKATILRLYPISSV